MNTQLFKVTFLFMLATAILCFFIVTELDYINAHLFILVRGWIQMIIIMELLLTTANTYMTFEKNKEYIIRLGTYKNYFKRMIKQSIFNQTVILIVQSFLIELGLLYTLALGFGSYQNWTSSFSFIYLVFQIGRFYILYTFVGICNILLFKGLKKEFVIGLNGILGALLITSSSTNTIYHFHNMQFLLHQQFTILNYQSFPTEIFCTIFYFIILGFILFGLYHWILHHVKKIGD